MKRKDEPHAGSGENPDGPDSSKRKGSATRLRDWSIRSVLVLLLVMLAVPSFREAGIRAKVSRVRSDMRSFAYTLKTYHGDHGFYPQWSTGTTSVNGAHFSHRDLRRLPSFRVDPGMRDPFVIADDGWEPLYYPADPFAPAKGATFVYYAPDKDDATAWYIASAGPDGDYDIDPATIDPWAEIPPIELSHLTYDPTNGTKSSGDIWQVDDRQKP